MNLKETFIWTGHEAGSVVLTRSSDFKPIPDYEKILEEFEASYDRPEAPGTLYQVYGGETISVIINDCQMDTSLTEFENWDATALFLKENGNSDLFIGFLKSIYENSGFLDFYACTIIEHLALKTNQTITVQTTDLEYGNEEFEITIQEDAD